MPKSNTYISRLFTLGHFGVQFGSEPRALDSVYREAGDILYRGPIDKAPDKVWTAIAPIHENFEKYNERAMAILYKGGGKLRSGTESAKMAVLSILTEREQALGYHEIIIWRILTPSCFIDRENFQTLMRCHANGDKQIFRSTEGKFGALQAKGFVPQWERDEHTTYSLVPIEQAIMEALYGNKFDMSEQDKTDWKLNVSKAFTKN